MTETRTTRVVALMAGNGVFLSGLWHHWLEGGNNFNWAGITSAVVALVGLSVAYFSLYWHKDRPLLVLEGISALCFAVNVFLYAVLSTLLPEI